jgi:hypothetical protein
MLLIATQHGENSEPVRHQKLGLADQPRSAAGTDSESGDPVRVRVDLGSGLPGGSGDWLAEHRYPPFCRSLTAYRKTKWLESCDVAAVVHPGSIQHRVGGLAGLADGGAGAFCPSGAPSLHFGDARPW